MSQIIEVKVPDIGDFKDVPIIEICVKAGDPVKAEDALLTLESDKATIDIPSPVDGIVKDIRVKIGDKVSEGTPIVRLEASVAGKQAEAGQKKAAADRLWQEGTALFNQGRPSEALAKFRESLGPKP